MPLLTLNTDVVFIPTDMIVANWPTRVSTVLVEEGDLAPAGTPLFNITQPGFTVTLSANASDRSQLQVGQQVTVQVQGGTTTAPGVITELDENATVDPQTGAQTYEGKVQVQGDLGAADGAPVNIDVILEDKPGVLTVPIAAVKQNGAGDDVVRVIDLARGGRIEERVVETGLAEGSFIEITDGLRGRRGRRGRGAELAHHDGHRDTHPAPRARGGLAGVRRAGQGLRAARGLAEDLRRRPSVDRRPVGVGEVDDARSAGRARSPERRCRSGSPART